MDKENREKLLKARENLLKARENLLKEFGTVDMNFQLPAHPSPRVVLPVMIYELLYYGNSMVEFNTGKSREHTEDFLRYRASAEVWKFWNLCNTVIGKAITCDNPLAIIKLYLKLSEYMQDLEGTPEEPDA